jgi:photosystem II stability/assembly factor-like uncharacterized protein
VKVSQLLSRTALLVAVAAPPAWAQSPAAAAAAATAAAPAARYDSLAFSALKWREIGPFRGGRSVAVGGSDARPRVYYLGTTGGGVMKTTDGGTTWKAITDKYFGGTIGSIAVSESNPNIVYVGTGESPIRGNVSHGDGVFKSTDAGKTWTYVGLKDTRQISRVRIDPRNPDVVYVGAQGHVWGPNPDRGVFKTTDGGKTWKKILFRNDSTGITDLVIDPTNPQTLYAAFWQAWREPWKLVSGGAGSGIFKSTDGGEHWTEITRNPGLPKGIIGNIGITASPVKAGRLWAVVEADSGGVFRSDDAGATWTRTNAERKLRQRAWYYSRIFADPKDANSVYVTNVGFLRSTDGGKTFKPITVPHGDNHDLWIASNDPKRMIESNDGGATVTVDGGATWTPEYQATAQFYHVETTTHFPYRVCGAQQDNSTLCGPSRKEGGISTDDWYDVGGGESGYIAVRPDSPNVVFAGSYGGLLTRFDENTGLSRDVNPWPDNPMGHDAADAKYRFQWTFPIVLSPHDPNTMYMGSSVVFRTTDEGQHWTAISPDLTRHDPRTLGASGGPITKDQTSVEYYGTVFAIAESPVQKGLIWAGSDDGLINITRDGGKTWTNVTPKGLPEWTRISIIEASHFSPGVAYVAANRYQLDDMRPYIYRTTDYGRTWKMIVSDIPETEFTRVVREDPVRRGLLYAGTERGVWVSFDDGDHWQTLRRNLPIVPVHDLAIKDGDLIAATHGRAFWIMDDLSTLRQLTPAIVSSNAHLFAPRHVYRANFYGGANSGATGGGPRAANPPSGAVVYYWLKAPKQVVTLDFLDAKGNVIRHFTSEQDSAAAADSVAAGAKKAARNDSLAKAGVSKDSIMKLERSSEETAPPAAGGRRGGPQTTRVANKQGLNMFDWNLRYPDAVTFKGLVFWGGGVTGPVAPPGTYAVRMTTGGVTQTQKFDILKDPRTNATQHDLDAQFAFLMKIRDTLSAANNAVRTVRNVRWQVEQRTNALAAGDRPAFERQTAPVLQKLSTIEQAIYQVQSHASEDPLNYPIRINNKIAALGGVVGGAAYRPTDQSYEVYNVLTAQLATQLNALHTTLAELKGANSYLAAHNATAIVPSTAEVKGPDSVAEDEGEAEMESESGRR